MTGSAPRPARSRARRAAIAAFGLVVTLGAAALVPLPERLGIEGSPVLRWHDGTVAHVELAPDGRWRVPTAVDAVDPDLVRALVALEDGRHGWHPGVDPLAIARAAWSNVRAGRVVSGASTLAMQVVRMTEPRPRTLRSKLVEAWRAIGVEARLGADGVVGAWLTHAPFGGNLEGVEAASWGLFGHGADALAPDEISLLLAIPQDPSGRRPRPGAEDALRAARRHVAERLAAAGLWTRPEATLAAIEAAPVPTQVRAAPRALPHVAAALRAAGHRPDGVTSLDRGVQRHAERTIARYAPVRRDQGIRHAAVLVVEAATGRVRAAIGNTSFDEAEGSQLPAWTVARSPGSTLKPFLYALALDDGARAAEQLVADVPRRFGSYAPGNHDGRFAGVVRFEEALSRSLNIPFVELLDELGPERLVASLTRAGARGLAQAPDHYGLSAIVGGLELRIDDVASLYTALATDGHPRPLTWWSHDAPPAVGPAWISPGAAWLTRRALRLRDRPDFPTRRSVAALDPGVAWKTGTSFAHRDAWAVGFDASHVIVVWWGNLDHTPSRHLVGAEAAGEVLFDLLDGLARPAADPTPDDLRPLEVCASTGHRPGSACPTRTRVLAPRQVPAGICPFHHAVEVEVATGRVVGPGCRSDGPTERRTVVRWPDEVAAWAPDHLDAPATGSEPSCAPVVATLRVVEPTDGSVVLLQPDLPAGRQRIPLRAGGGRPPYVWFVDGAALDAADPSWAPVPGTHTLLVADRDGATARRIVRVRARNGPFAP